MTKFRRSKQVLPPQPPLDDRLTALLEQWGEFVRTYKPNAWSTIAPIYKMAPADHYDTDELIDRFEPNTMQAVSAAIDDMMRTDPRLWMVLHWHYARRLNWPGPAVWRTRQLPADDSPEYGALLKIARTILVHHLTTRRVLF